MREVDVPQYFSWPEFMTANETVVKGVRELVGADGGRHPLHNVAGPTMADAATYFPSQCSICVGLLRNESQSVRMNTI